MTNTAPIFLDGLMFLSARKFRIARMDSCNKVNCAIFASSQSSTSRGSGHFAMIRASGQSLDTSFNEDSRKALRRCPQSSSVTNGVKGWSSRSEMSNTRARVSTVEYRVSSFFICSLAISTYQSAKSLQMNS